VGGLWPRYAPFFMFFFASLTRMRRAWRGSSLSQFLVILLGYIQALGRCKARSRQFDLTCAHSSSQRRQQQRTKTTTPHVAKDPHPPAAHRKTTAQWRRARSSGCCPPPPPPSLPKVGVFVITTHHYPEPYRFDPRASGEVHATPGDLCRCDCTCQGPLAFCAQCLRTTMAPPAATTMWTLTPMAGRDCATRLRRRFGRPCLDSHLHAQPTRDDTHHRDRLRGPPSR